MLGEYVRQRTRELQLALFGHQEDAETEGARAVQDASEISGVDFQETGDISNDQGSWGKTPLWEVCYDQEGALDDVESLKPWGYF